MAPSIRVHRPWSRTAAQERQEGTDGQTSAQTSTPGTSRLRRWLGSSALVAAVIGISLGYYRSIAARTLPQGLLQLNGRIEGDDVTLASKVSGRIHTLVAREGDLVHAGKPIASLDDAVTRARLAEAIASRDVALAKVDAARADLVVLRAQVPIGIDSAAAELKVTEATLEQARAQEAQAARDQTRVANLLASGSIDPQSDERATLAHDTALHALAAARAARDKAVTSLFNARLAPNQVRAKEAELVSLEAAARQAGAQVDEVQSMLDDLTIVSPVEGTVTTRFVDVGQVVSAGTPILEVVDLDRLYLKAFVPEADVGKLHVGSIGRVYTDAFPGRPAAATVRYVASRSEFTPKEVQTRDERVKLVYTVKLYVDDNRDRRLVPGLGADAVVRWREDAPWSPPR